MRRWLARLGFSFLILGGVFAYEGYRESSGRNGPVRGTRVGLFYAGSVVAFVLGGAGMRERHRPRASVNDRTDSDTTH